MVSPLYGAVFDKWSPRTSDEFDSFATDTSDPGAIDWVGVAGLRYKAERWWKIDVRYKVPVPAGLSFRGIYHDYTADESGSVDGVKDDDRDIRLYLDCVHRF